jgi:hypothetical protein
MSSASEISYFSERIAAIRIESFEIYVENCFTDDYHMKCILLHKHRLLTLELSVLCATIDSLVENGID